MEKDTQAKASEPEINLKSYLVDAYLHPIFRSFEEVDLSEVKVDKTPDTIPSQPTTPDHVPSQPSTPDRIVKQQETETVSRSRSPSPPHDLHQEHEESAAVQHYEFGPPANVYHYGYEHHESIFHYSMDDHYGSTQHDIQDYVAESPHGYYHY